MSLANMLNRLARHLRPSKITIVRILISMGIGTWFFVIGTVTVENLITNYPNLGLQISPGILRIIGAAGFLIGFLSSWTGQSSVPILLAIAYLISTGALGHVDLITVMESLLFATIIHYLRVVRDISSAMIRVGDRLWSIVSLAAMATVLVVTAGAIALLTPELLSSVYNIMDKAPVTLRSFYTTLFSTRIGRLFLSASIVSVLVTTVYTVNNTIVQALTMNPEAASARIQHELRQRLEELIRGKSSEDRILRTSFYFVASLLIYPIISVLVGWLRDVLSLPSELFSGWVGGLLTTTIYILSWLPARYAIDSLQLLPSSMRRVFRDSIRSPSISAPRAAITRLLATIGVIIMAGIVYSLLFGVQVSGLISGVLLGRDYTDPLSVYASHLESVDEIIDGYINRLGRILGILARLLWGG